MSIWLFFGILLTITSKIGFLSDSSIWIALIGILSEIILEEYCEILSEKQDACYHKVKARYDVWPSAYASGALVKCRKVGAKNWGNKSKKESIEEYDVVNEQDYQDFME